MRVKTTKDLYHKPDCSSPIIQAVMHAAETRHEPLEELEQEGYDPCSECFPERAE